jgi:DNA-binding transcriptional LysR family regulator
MMLSTVLFSGAVDISIGHLGRSYDDIESMLLIRERIVVALPKGHKAARKRAVGLRDLEGDLFIIPSKDVLPSLHQMIVAIFLQGRRHSGRASETTDILEAVAAGKIREIAISPKLAMAFVGVDQISG